MGGEIQHDAKKFVMKTEDRGKSRQFIFCWFKHPLCAGAVQRPRKQSERLWPVASFMSPALSS